MQWRLVKGFEGVYEISEYGNVRSLDRMELQPARIRNGKRIEAFYRKRKGFDIKPKSFSENGYLMVELNHNRIYQFQTHRLVYEAFVSKIEDGNIVHHIDGNKRNNHYNNLKQMNIIEHNNIHSHPAWNKGIPNSQETIDRHKKTRWKNHLPRCKESYDLQRQGYTLKQIANIQGISEGSLVGRMRKYKKHIGETKKFHATDLYREGKIPEGIYKFDCAKCGGVFFSKKKCPTRCWNCNSRLWEGVTDEKRRPEAPD